MKSPSCFGNNPTCALPLSLCILHLPCVFTLELKSSAAEQHFQSNKIYSRYNILPYFNLRHIWISEIRDTDLNVRHFNSQCSITTDSQCKSIFREDGSSQNWHLLLCLDTIWKGMQGVINIITFQIVLLVATVYLHSVILHVVLLSNQRIGDWGFTLSCTTARHSAQRKYRQWCNVLQMALGL